MTDPNRAKRTGEKAPWPKGKPRNPIDPRWESLRVRVVDLLELKGERGLYCGTCTAAHIAELCGCTASNVSKWLKGKRNPPKSAITTMAKWARENK